MVFLRKCINCGDVFKYDPADGLEKYCEACYNALGLGDGPGQTYQGDTPTGDQGEPGAAGWVGYGVAGIEPCEKCGMPVDQNEVRCEDCGATNPRTFHLNPGS